MSVLAVRLEQLREMSEIQSRPGNWDLTAYNHGLANGIKLAVAIMSGAEPDYLKEPPEGYKGLGPKAVASKAVPSGIDLAKETPPISPENLGTIDVPGAKGNVSAPPPVDVPGTRGVSAALYGKKPEPTPAPPAQKEKETMAKKAKPAPKKVAKGAKAKPIAKAKAKASKKASIRKKASTFKGAAKRGKVKRAKASLR